VTVLAAFPSPPFDSLAIGPLDLHLYGLMIALGVIAAVWLFGRRLAERGYGDGEDAGSVGTWGVVGGVVGARLYHVATEWDRFSDNLGDIPKIWEGGLGIPGGIVGGVLAGAYAGWRRGLPVSVQLTMAAPALPLAQAIGRWGNWFNQELFGRATDLPWALEVDVEHLPTGYAEGTTFHPTFLYESLWNLGLCGALLLIDRRRGNQLGPGRLFPLYLVGYGVGRFWIEGLRIDAVELSDVAGLRWNQWVALAMIVGGGLWFVVTRPREWPPVAATGEPHELDDPGESIDELAALDGVDPAALDDVPESPDYPLVDDDDDLGDSSGRPAR